MGKKSMRKMSGSKVSPELLGKPRKLEVKNILEKKYRLDCPEPLYLVQWVGYPKGASKWIQKSNLKLCKWSINRFDADLRKAQKLAAEAERGRKHGSKKLSKTNNDGSWRRRELACMSATKSEEMLETQQESSDDEDSEEDVCTYKIACMSARPRSSVCGR